MPDEQTTVAEVEEIVWRRGGGSIPRERVREWMSSADLSVLGAVWELVIENQKALDRIEPPLTEEEHDDFRLGYYELCMAANPHFDYGLSRYEAAREVYALFRRAPQEWVDDGFLPRVKDRLAALYRKSDADVRLAIETGALEHILEETRWQRFFEDWQSDPLLKEAYDRAMEWALQHPADSDENGG